MKKILFVSNETSENKNILNAVSDKYIVKSCAPVPENISLHMSDFMPDMIIVCMTDAEYDYLPVIRFLKGSTDSVILLIITTENIWHEVKRFAEGLRCSRLTRPFSEKTLITRCSELFDDWKVVKTAEIRRPALFKEAGEKIKVLLADDSAIILRSVKLMLQEEFDVVLANSGQMALEKVQKELPDIVLLDYEMPDMCGNEVFEKMLAIDSCKNIPVIFLTAVSDRERVFDVLKNKPAGYLLKPITKVQITDAINSMFKSE